MHKALYVVLPVIVLSACHGDAPQPRELSGLVVAADGSHYWGHNDGPDYPYEKDDPTLYLLDRDGKIHQRVALRGTTNRDWEDIAAFVQNGQRYLVVAETGDNNSVHEESFLYTVKEPAPGSTEVPSERTISFRFPDHPLDCESVAVDPQTNSIILVSKREVPPAVYRLPLDAAPKTLHVADRIGTIPGLLKASWWERVKNPWQGPYAAQPTGLDISPDGKVIALQTYKNLYVWHRKGPALFEGNPTIIPMPAVDQWEGVAINGNTVVVGKERGPNLQQFSLTN